MSSDSDDASSGAGRHIPAPSRRVIDLELDDGDDDWEDLASQSLGTSTHRSRNPGQPRIPLHKRKRKLGGTNARASALKKRGANTSKMKRLSGDLDALDEELNERAEKLAEKYSMKLNDVRQRMFASSAYKTQRKPSLYNAKISVIMADLNADREEGSRLTTPEVKAIVKDDPSLLEGYTAEEEAQMLADLEAKRERKHCGTRTNNISANADIKRTVTRLVDELNGMALHANMVGFAMFSRGHLHDTSTPTTISTGGALDFFRDILKKEPADVSALFELWAVSWEKGAKAGNTLRGMQKECTDMILTGLMAVTRRTKIAMNYENYISSMVEGKNVGLVGWPQGVTFKRMSLQSALPPLQILHAVLKAGTCRWKVLTPTERERIVEKFEDMVEKGEVKVKPKKGAGTTAGKSSRAATKKSSAKKKGNESSGESSEEDESDGEEALWGSGATVREKLLALVQRNKAKGAAKERKRKGKAASAGDDDARPTKKAPARDEDAPARHKKKSATVKPKKTSTGNGELPAKKRKKPSAGDGDSAPPAKKRKKSAGNDGKPPAKKRKKRSAEAGDDAPSAKRKKTSAQEDEPAVPAVARPRPKPRRLLKKAASPAAPARSPAASAAPARSPAASTAPARSVSPTPCSPAASAAPASQAAPARPTVKGKRGGPPGQRA
ncbi:hypothetical protein DFH09DRAFT_1322237 [Mycena vulgaris]|nr:hypothetical protein DFH09DRAFT_1322237 [Mycena vulgaris]